MKKILIIAAFALAFNAYADSGSGAGAGQKQDTTVSSTGTASSDNAGNLQSITFTSPDKTTADVNQNVSGTQTIRNVPSVSGPPLTTSNDTCMGSTSGSANAPGIGLSFGTTWTDTNCKMLKNSREMWNMGMKAAAMALMCTDPANREALEITGYECPQSKKNRDGKTAQAQQEQYTDPYIRARLGLPPLK